MITKNRMSAEKAYNLYRWLEQNKDQVKFLTYEKIAHLATKELGFIVTISNVQVGFGVTKIEKVNKPRIPKTSGNKTEANPSKILHHRDRTIARALLTLCKELGHMPRNLENLKSIAEYEDIPDYE